MMKKLALFLLAAAWAVAGFAQDRLYADEFPLGDVKLLDGPLQKARDLNIQTLLQYDCDRLLAPYRIQLPTGSRPDWSPGRRPIPTGTAWTAMWAATTWPRWR